MGLCKCPQRKVTTLFCYEHRVNVCEQCLMNNHPKCVVDTHKNWITDSVFSSKCGLCDQELRDAETIRLMCLHIVHWECLDRWAKSLPPTTAPAGYLCPICKKMCVFPAQNQISPIADYLRQKMSSVNWARIGLGLPALEDNPAAINGYFESNDPGSREGYSIPMNATTSTEYGKNPNTFNSNMNAHRETRKYSTENKTVNHVYVPSEPVVAKSEWSNQYSSINGPHHSPSLSSFREHSAVIDNVPSNIPSSRKGVRFESDTPLLIYEDEEKYKRKSAFESFNRWLRLFYPISNRNRLSRRRKIAYGIIFAIVCLIILMILFGRGDEDEELFEFDPKANPNVLVGRGPPLDHDIEN